MVAIYRRAVNVAFLWTDFILPTFSPEDANRSNFQNIQASLEKLCKGQSTETSYPYSAVLQCNQNKHKLAMAAK
jgi:hypothetical protein